MGLWRAAALLAVPLMLTWASLGKIQFFAIPIFAIPNSSNLLIEGEISIVANTSCNPGMNLNQDPRNPVSMKITTQEMFVLWTSKSY